MAKQLPDTRVGAHPTVREFVHLLETWGFKPARGQRTDRHHVILRGPHGGRIQILASLQGRADADRIARAARLVQVDVDTFLAGPPSKATNASPPAATAQQPERESQDTPSPRRARPTRRTTSAVRGDSTVSLVLTTHAQHDRPMRFEEIVDLCGGRVSRTQVGEASAHLCRIGQLARICEGVYQWAHGTRRANSLSNPPVAPTGPQQSFTPPASPSAAEEPVDELFARLFPRGVRMTPQLLRDLQQWTELTRTLAAHADEGP